jgi:hypothetical protein
MINVRIGDDLFPRLAGAYCIFAGSPSSFWSWSLIVGLIEQLVDRRLQLKGVFPEGRSRSPAMTMP